MPSTKWSQARVSATKALQRGIWPYLQLLQTCGLSVPQFPLCRGPVLQTSWAKGFENNPGEMLDPNSF